MLCLLTCDVLQSSIMVVTKDESESRVSKYVRNVHVKFAKLAYNSHFQLVVTEEQARL